MNTSTKYPTTPLAFPWFKPEDQSAFPCVMYPNWHYGNRPSLPDKASQARVLHYHHDYGAHALLDFDMMYFIGRLKKGDKVIMCIQSPDGSVLRAVVATIQSLFWDWDSDDYFPHINYTCENARSIWSTYLLGIAPFNMYHKAGFYEQEHIWRSADANSSFLDLVRSYGIYRACRLDVPLFQVASFNEFDRFEMVRQQLEGEHLLRPGDRIEWEAAQFHGQAEIVTADDTPSGGHTNVTIRRLS